MAYHALVPAAGNGFRFGGSMPKQYLLLNGKPVLQHALDRLQSHFPLQRTYVALAHDDHWFEELIGMPHDVTLLRCGGATRAESVRNALERLDHVAFDDWIVVHDAVRPCLDRAAALRLQQELAGDDVGGFLAVPVSDTLKRLGDDARVLRTESRDALWRAQTPQMFRYGVLRRAFALPGLDRRTDEAHAVEALGLAPRGIAGSAANVKITFPEDMLLAAAILNAETPPSAAQTSG
jgi:2-C-methyl-D-erythritol 4-phosphate cytidylyltransferase